MDWYMGRLEIRRKGQSGWQEPDFIKECSFHDAQEIMDTYSKDYEGMYFPQTISMESCS